MAQSETSVLRRYRSALILTAALVLAPGSCRPGEGPPPNQPPNRPNIIFLTVDTLRADHLELYGYPRSTMPVINEFAKSAVVFDNAVVPRGSTRPSYASMLTGLYPFHHGVRPHGAVLHQELTTLAECLRGHGYHTAAFVSNSVLLGEESGYDQGFDLYDDRLEGREPNLPRYERRASKTLEAIVQWLGADPPQPFFLFTNFMDPHGPYHPPERFRQRYVSKRHRQVPPGRIPQYQRMPGVTNFYDYVDRYDAEIRYVDESMGVLIEELKRRNLWDSSFVVFTADHGESMGEHGQFFEHHAHVFEETMRVPLVIRPPRAAAERPAVTPRRVASVCSPMDLMPTVLAYLDIPYDGLCDGMNLLPVLYGASDAERFVFLEFPDVATWHRSLPDIYAVRTATHKLIRILDARTGRMKHQAVFQVTADPVELSPIPYDDGIALHRTLGERLDAMIAQVNAYELPFTVTQYEPPRGMDFEEQNDQDPSNTKITKPMTQEQIERLRSLGYIQ